MSNERRANSFGMKQNKIGVVDMVIKKLMTIQNHGLLKYQIALVCSQYIISFRYHIPFSSDPNEDQFAKRAAAKKERVAKNEFQRLKNIARANKVNGKFSSNNLQKFTQSISVRNDGALITKKSSTNDVSHIQ